MRLVDQRRAAFGDRREGVFDDQRVAVAVVGELPIDVLAIPPSFTGSP